MRHTYIEGREALGGAGAAHPWPDTQRGVLDLAGTGGDGHVRGEHVALEARSLQDLHVRDAVGETALGRDAEAIVEYKKEVARSSDNPDVLYQLGHSLLETGDWQAASGYLKSAAQLDPQNADASYDFGKSLLLSGDAATAITALRHALEVNPANASAHYQLSRALDKLGQKGEAQLERQRFVELKKSQPQSGGMASGRSQ